MRVITKRTTAMIACMALALTGLAGCGSQKNDAAAKGNSYLHSLDA